MSTVSKQAGVAWLDLLKLIVIPVAFLAGGAVISIEIRISRMDAELRHLHERVETMPAPWLREQVSEMRVQLKEIEQRLRTVEKQTK